MRNKTAAEKLAAAGIKPAQGSRADIQAYLARVPTPATHQTHRVPEPHFQWRRVDKQG